MKKKLWIGGALVLVLAVVLALVIASCGPKDRSIVGTWKSASYGTLEFRANGTYISGDSKLTYEADAGVLTLSDGRSYHYEITSGTLDESGGVYMLTLWDYGTSGYDLRVYTKG